MRTNQAKGFGGAIGRTHHDGCPRSRESRTRITRPGFVDVDGPQMPAQTSRDRRAAARATARVIAGLIRQARHPIEVPLLGCRRPPLTGL
jgi:hypothetical protein